MDFYSLLQQLVDEDGSDLYLSTGAPPSAKFQGELVQLSDHVFKKGEIQAIANEILNEDQRAEFAERFEMNLAIAPENIGRFRVNLFIQRNEVSIVARNIQTDIPKISDLGLPEILKDVITAKNGLVLFVGGTGSGKSTSLAALIDHRNSARGGHIITIEDPVEYVHQHKKCIVNQREVGVDTLSYHDALKNTLRQAPDVILIGEIRDRETMEHALAFAETGHLAISTLHANNANQALDRIINFFPEERRTQLLQDMGNNLRAFISQRLVATVDGKRCAAIEIMLGSHTIKKMIQSGDFSEIKEVMQKSENHGMKTFDSALFDLVVEGKISQEEALKNADSANNLRLKLKFSGIEMDEEDDDPTALLMRGERPEKAANDADNETETKDQSATAAETHDADAATPKAPPASEESTDLGAMLAAAANPDNSPADSPEPSANTSEPADNSSAPAPAAPLTLSLHEEPEEAPDEAPEIGDDGVEIPKFGMGRIG